MEAKTVRHEITSDAGGGGGAGGGSGSGTQYSEYQKHQQVEGERP
jgi:hypothetical protein